MSAKLPKRPDMMAIEHKWQNFWEKAECYRFDPDPANKAEIFSIDVPPRYVSGPLHVGHAVSYTHIDFIARYQRLRGKNVFNPLCFDGNGLPVEVKVEEQGFSPATVGREAFLEECEKFSRKNIKTMSAQFKRLGHSFDPSLYYQTNMKEYRRITQLTFLAMLEKGHIYRGERPVNWCPRCDTALADAEIDYKEGETSLHYLRFRINGDAGDDHVLIATTRPELLPACVLAAVHPEDEKHSHLVGRKLDVPHFDRTVEVVADESVDPEFGTGIVMVCTFGDKEDIEKVQKFETEMVKAINEQGKMTEAAAPYTGMPIKEARKQIVEALENEGLLDHSASHSNRYGACWRCSTPIEYILTRQWFLEVLPFKERIKETAARMEWRPAFMKTRLDNWTDSLKWDWCISRQRYFATPIPAWTCSVCGQIVPADEDMCYVDPVVDKAPRDECPECGGGLEPVTDVFDTWFDSSITAIYNAHWKRDDALFNRLHPMSLRPQAHDIIRTWAFYSTLRSLLLTGKEPFSNMAVSGFILGPDGRPMHASDGNVVDPLEVIDEYGCEAMRFFAAHCGLGVDTAYNFETTKHGVSFNIKLWNISRFIGMQLKDFDPGFDPSGKYSTMDRWMLSNLADLIDNISRAYDEYDFHAAILALEDFIWHILADNYLEIAKHRLFDKSNDASRRTAQSVLERVIFAVLKGLAPILPHITEEIFSVLMEHRESKSVHDGGWPVETFRDEDAVAAGDAALKAISAMRKWKQDNQMGLGTQLNALVIACPDPDLLAKVSAEIAGTSRTDKIDFLKGDDYVVVSGEKKEKK